MSLTQVIFGIQNSVIRVVIALAVLDYEAKNTAS